MRITGKESTGSLEVFGMSEWISVSERLPIQGERVICYSRSLGTRFGVKLPEALSQTVGIRPEGCLGCDEHTTHWMPDPDPPETTP